LASARSEVPSIPVMLPAAGAQADHDRHSLVVVEQQRGSIAPTPSR
jgi:hypothetical protein